ncbi:MAG TPA: peptidoglycan DD-metalloendopeptidase family protein [Candidatus Limnocylindrales bacterium]|nr:peptidoglycan DD-metalloendopeptidase family protein [Candidatus Limnocylindrales bacterium]
MSLLLLIPLLVGIIGGAASPVGADELSDARARQAALTAKLAKQKAEVAQINSLQSELTTQIASTKRELGGINADLVKVRKSINAMIVKINAVKAQYTALVGKLHELDTQLRQIQVDALHKEWALADRKALLAERVRVAYDTNRTSLLETFLSGASFTDVLSEVSYSIDVGEQDKALAEQIVNDQEALASLHQIVAETRVATEELRVEVAAQKVKLDAGLKAQKAAEAELKRLEDATRKALAIQKAAYARVLRNKHNLAKAMAAAAAAKRALANKISDLVAQQYAHGNIPSKFNGTLKWPMAGQVTQDFGCTGFAWEPPLGSCAHYHQGIDVVAPANTPVRASGAGTVVYCGWNWADGADPAWIVIIAHSQGLETWYAHMTPNCPVPPGGRTQAGQVIGHEGNTGHSTGAHLHWAVRYNSSFVNPRLFV